MPVRIAYIVREDEAVKHLFLEQLLDLRHRGYDPLIVCSPGHFVTLFRKLGLQVREVPMQRRIDVMADLTTLLSLTRVLAQERPEIVHAHTTKAIFVTAPAARMAKVGSTVVSVHGYYHRDASLPRPLMAVYRAAAAWCDAWIVTNRQDLTDTLRFRIADPAIVRYIRAGTGVNTERFVPASPQEKLRMRSRIGLLDDQLVVGYVGRLMRFKGVQRLAQALGHLRSSFPHLHALVVWDTEAEPAVLEVVERMRTEGLATVLENQSHMEQIYPVMDLLVLPSSREGLPAAMMEAASCGVPIVASNIPGCREIVLDGRCGLLAPPGDTRALARAIGGLLSDADGRTEMGQRGAAFARACLDQRAVFAEIAEIYESLLTG